MIYKDSKRTPKVKTLYFGHGDEFVFNRNGNLRLKKLHSQKYIKARADPLSS